jgi:hypothetical protein
VSSTWSPRTTGLAATALNTSSARQRNRPATRPLAGSTASTSSRIQAITIGLP